LPEGKAPPIGRLRNYAAVFEWTDEPIAGNSSVTPTYAPRGHCFCSLKAKGDLWIGAAQIVEQNGSRGTHVIRTRFRDDLTTRHLFEIAGNRYRILGIRPDDARRFIELEAELYGDAQLIGAPPVLPRTSWDDGQSIWDNNASEPWDP